MKEDKLNRRFVTPEGKISRRDLLKLASPLGKVMLDSSKCTGCGLCALECPTRALTLSSGGEDSLCQLLFKHNLCLACSQCVEVCPEQCLKLERTLETDRIGSPAVVLFESNMVRCRDCGNIIGSRAMVNRLQAKLGKSFAPQLELCPACKIKVLGYR